MDNSIFVNRKQEEESIIFDKRSLRTNILYSLADSTNIDRRGCGELPYTKYYDNQSSHPREKSAKIPILEFRSVILSAIWPRI